MVETRPKVPLHGTAKNSPFGGDLKRKNQKSREKQLTDPFSFIFNKTDCPGKWFIFGKMKFFLGKSRLFLSYTTYKNTRELSIFWKTNFRKPCCTLHDRKHFLAPLLSARPRANTNTTAQ